MIANADVATTSEVVRQIPSGDDFLSPERLKALTTKAIIAATTALKPRLAEMAAVAERQRRPIDELWAELRASGYFYMLIPKRYGGLEADIDDVIDASLPIAEGCGSTGWLAMFGLVHNRHMITYPDEVLEELFGGGRYIIEAGGTMPPGQAVPVEGGYRLSGRWNWGTCITQADWVQVLAMVRRGEGKPSAGHVPVARARSRNHRHVADRWHVRNRHARLRM